jgi:ABC-type transporter Mla MlaB component
MSRLKRVPCKFEQNLTMSAGTSIVLPDICTLREIAGLHECLRAASREATLDGSSVQRIDSTGVQLLVAFVRERRAAHEQIQWRGVSAALSDVVLMLGMANAVNLPTIP